MEDLGYRLLLKGVNERNRERIFEWVLGKMDEFGPFLGLSFDGLEAKTMELFRLGEKNQRKVGGGLGSRSVEE